MIRPDEIFKIGYVARVHGLAGEVDFVFTDDVFDRAETDCLFLMLDGLPVPFFIDSYRFKNGSTAIMKFDEIDTVERAQTLCGADVYFPLADVPERDEAPLTWNYLTGFLVEDVATGVIGTVDYVDDRNANLHEDFLAAIDEKARRITLKLPEGLLNLNN